MHSMMPGMQGGVLEWEYIRAHVLFTEGRHFLENTSETFDVIVLDLTDPTDHSKLLYTQEFYQVQAIWKNTNPHFQ